MCMRNKNFICVIRIAIGCYADWETCLNGDGDLYKASPDANGYPTLSFVSESITTKHGNALHCRALLPFFDYCKRKTRA